MEEPIVFEFTAINPSLWIENFSKSFKGKMIDNVAQIDNDYGNGQASYLEIEDGFYITAIDIFLHRPIIAVRKSVDHAEYYPIIHFYGNNEVEHSMGGKTRKMSAQSPYGVFAASSIIESKTYIESNTRLKNIGLALSYNWIVENLNIDEGQYIYQCVINKNPFLIIENIDFETQKLLNSVLEVSKSKKSKMLIKALSLQVLYIFLEKTTNRDSKENAQDLITADVEKLFKTKKLYSKV